MAIKDKMSIARTHLARAIEAEKIALECKYPGHHWWDFCDNCLDNALRAEDQAIREGQVYQRREKLFDLFYSGALKELSDAVGLALERKRNKI